MSRSLFRFSPFPRILLPMLAGMMALAVSRVQSQAEEADHQPVVHSYVMPANDGYGITECIATAGACGRVVADAWCEAHGHAQAIAYGRAEDVTGAIAEPFAEKAVFEPGSYIVTCAE